MARGRSGEGSRNGSAESCGRWGDSTLLEHGGWGRQGRLAREWKGGWGRCSWPGPRAL